MPMPRIQMCDGGPTFSRVSQGLASSARWDMDADGMARFVESGVDVGVTTLDTAARYGGGRSETLLGDALAERAGLRDRVEIVTKCGIGTFGTSFRHYDAGRPSSSRSTSLYGG